MQHITILMTGSSTGNYLLFRKNISGTFNCSAVYFMFERPLTIMSILIFYYKIQYNTIRIIEYINKKQQLKHQSELLLKMQKWQLIAHVFYGLFRKYCKMFLLSILINKKLFF